MDDLQQIVDELSKQLADFDAAAKKAMQMMASAEALSSWRPSVLHLCAGSPSSRPWCHPCAIHSPRAGLYALGKVPNRKAHLHCFVDGLNDDDSSVVHAALQALSGLKDSSLLPHYRRVAERYSEERALLNFKWVAEREG